MKPHVFVAMPFGVKPGHDGSPIDFNRIYDDYLVPALAAAGLDVFRADEELRAGDIRTDMFQELLIADLVVADLTLDNPNVWYELGVRHALRARGVILVQGPRPTQPFDIYTDRKLHYRLKDGMPDPATLAEDREALTRMAVATLQAWQGRKLSPVYNLLPNLREPDWKTLLLAERNEFSVAYEEWASRMEVARQKTRAGDILVLADETPTRALRIEARRAAGEALLKLRHYDFALEQFEAVLALLSGRVEKDNWMSRWRRDGASAVELHEAAAFEDAALADAIEPYRKAFIIDPSHHYSGINALTLQMLRRHLGGADEPVLIDNLVGGVLWAALTAQERSHKDYWARASYAELCLLVNPLDTVRREYGATAAAANGDWFALDSSRQTLCLLRDLEFRPPETAAALGIIDREISRRTPPFQPRRVFLFSGHMIDAPDRASPRFPPDKEAIAAQGIAAALDALGAGPGDLALAQGASGGDLLFLEACKARGVRLQLMLPFAEPEFIERSILPAADGARWCERYYTLRAGLPDAPRIMPTELGPLPKTGRTERMNAYERCNRWLLNTALAWGVDRVHFVCLWNGASGDGTGGTAHMYEEVKRRTGRVSWIDTRMLW
ncbi:MAG: hypothetical protein PWP11_2508 [Thauera sp.]|nr:TRAFs-binding domain-containing protein [Thauera sp.]MDI3491231.1 hypothetical protein [Thauera sp.]